MLDRLHKRTKLPLAPCDYSCRNAKKASKPSQKYPKNTWLTHGNGTVAGGVIYYWTHFQRRFVVVARATKKIPQAKINNKHAGEELPHRGRHLWRPCPPFPSRLPRPPQLPLPLPPPPCLTPRRPPLFRHTNERSKKAHATGTYHSMRVREKSAPPTSGRTATFFPVVQRSFFYYHTSRRVETRQYFARLETITFFMLF